MATITTANVADPLDWPGQSYLDRNPLNGDLFIIIQKPSSVWELWTSNDNGTSWTLALSLTRGISEASSIVIDNVGRLHWAYRVNQSSQDRIYYRRVDLMASSLSWDAEVLTGSPANGGVAGAVHTGIDIQAVLNTGNTYVAIAVGTTLGANTGVTLYGVLTTSNGQHTYTNNILKGSRQWLSTGSGRITPSLEFEHIGDPKTAAVANLWVTWGRTNVYIAKLPWIGGGWQGPPSAQLITINLTTAQDSIPGRWDGIRFLIALPNHVGSANTVRVYQRNRANTVTTIVASPSHPTGNIRNCTIAYNDTVGDFRVYALGTSTNVLYYVDYIRATGAWTSWAQVTANLVVGTTGQNYGVRRGVTGNARFDVYYATGTAPFTIAHVAQIISYTPTVPKWSTGTMAYSSGSAADVNASLLLDWIFSDPDPADVQSAYALSRQIGSGALSYWRASDSTWQATEIKNISGTTQVTLASGWASGTDDPYKFAVKVWDSADIPSTSYSAPFVLIPSVKANPTVTAPTPSQIINGNSLTVTWTVSEQSSYRVRLVTGSQTVFDSRWVIGADTTYIPSYVLRDGFSYSVFVSTKNLEGLPSNEIQVDFSVDFVEPPVGVITLTPSTANGHIAVSMTNPAAVGTQPTLISHDLYRRAVGPAVLNVNPYFEVDTADWAATGGALARSSAQAHQGTWSARLVPDGVTSLSRIETGLYTIDPESTYHVQTWVRPDTGNKPIRVYLDWHDVSNVFLSRSSFTITSVATAWIFGQGVFTPVPFAEKVKVGVGIDSTPAASDAAYFDQIELRQSDDNTGTLLITGLSAAAASTVHNDWRAAARTAYEYRTLSHGSNGTSVYGPWTS